MLEDFATIAAYGSVPNTRLSSQVIGPWRAACSLHENAPAVKVGLETP